MPRSLTHFLPLIFFALLAAMAAIALMSTLSGERKLSELPSALIGKPVPETELANLFNEQEFLTLRGATARPYLVNFFASWCAPCRAEAPALAILAKEIDIIGIAYKDKAEDSQRFLSEYGNPYQAVGMDNDGMAGLNWGVYGVPETYVISSDGVILMRHAGPIDGEVLRDEFLPLVQTLKTGR